MKITRIEAVPYSIPYVHPLYFASGSVAEADHVLVRVHTDEGIVGVADTHGNPIKDAQVEIWHADAAGFYSQYAPGLPEWLFRGTVKADENGYFEINTMQPAPYQIPTDGACGQLIGAAGWHAWRPAHIHIKVSAPGYQLVTQQLYFPGDPHNEDDIASAVKPELMLDVKEREGGQGNQVEYNYVLAKEHESK